MLVYRLVYTAAEAQCAFMADHVEPGSKVFVISGGGDFWKDLVRELDPELLDSWDVRTSLSEAEAKQWATVAAAHPRQSLVWVVFFVDGPIGKGAEVTKHSIGGSADLEVQLDWSYDLIYKLSIMLSHGAEFVMSHVESGPFAPWSCAIARHTGLLGRIYRRPSCAAHSATARWQQFGGSC